MSGEKSFNPYLWLVWGLPAAVVIAGIATVLIAFHDPDPLISDDYYRDGLAINQNVEADKRALLLQLSATIRQQSNRIELQLSGNLPFPTQLKLEFEHPTRVQQDRHWQLSHRENGWYHVDDAALTPDLQSGNWYITLTPPDEVWRLRSNANFADEIHLTGSK